MSARSCEIVLARLYTDPEFRAEFLEDPRAALMDCDLTAEEIRGFAAMDKVGLQMAAKSFFVKRKKRRGWFYRNFAIWRQSKYWPASLR